MQTTSMQDIVNHLKELAQDIDDQAAGDPDVYAKDLNAYVVNLWDAYHDSRLHSTPDTLMLMKGLQWAANAAKKLHKAYD